MAQISRPFQIALVAFALLAAVWFFALHGNSNTSGSASTATPPTPASSPSAAQKAAAPSRIYHGPAPGVSGLTRAVAKAHEAVATSQQNAKQLEQKSNQASSSAPQSNSGGTAAAPSTSASSAAGASASKSKAAPASPTIHKQLPIHKPAGAVTSPVLQRTVEAELKHGKIAVLLFWNRKGADDVVSHKAIRQVMTQHREASKIAVHESPASAVASYGTITRGAQIYGTPTILIINNRHQATIITGSTDAYSIEQAIDEARKA
jgi:hypothetical protein